MDISETANCVMTRGEMSALFENTAGKRSITSLRKTRLDAVVFTNKTEKTNTILTDPIKNTKKLQIETGVDVHISSYR